MITTVIAICAFGISLISFFSGFGLGTVLTPVLAIWFPIELAIVLTAVVHLLNNLFKLLLLGRYVHWRTVMRFGLPAALSAGLGASLLLHFSHLEPIAKYSLWGRELEIIPINLTVAFLIITFTVLEIFPRFKNWTVNEKYIPLGGILSGFFGGLSGHQGALRSIFLLRSGLAKENFIATGVFIACIIDLARLTIYSVGFSKILVADHAAVLLVATLSAFAGAYLGSRILKKVTMVAVHWVVTIGLLLLSICIGMGLI